MTMHVTPTSGTLTRARPVDPPPSFSAEDAKGSALYFDYYLEPKSSIVPFSPFIEDRTNKHFRTHERRWKQQTRHISSPVDKYLHPSYARIIGLGWPAVTHILKSLKKQPADWFYALRAITGENPVPASAAGDMRRMTNLWIKWGERRGLI